MCDASCAPDSPCFVGWVTRLVRAHRPRLVAVARAEGLDAAAAPDAVQEGLLTFLGLPQAVAAAGRDDDGARLLTAVVRNAARNLRRRHHRARPHDGDADLVPAEDGDAAELLARAEARVAVSACVAELGPAARAVVMLRLLDEASGDAAAAELGTTPGNVAVMLHRARARLRACLAAADEPGPTARTAR
jgi:RNA polymerase sigma factor (sigma-70 family)